MPPVTAWKIPENCQADCEVPLHESPHITASPDREGGRGLILCSALAGRWGVEYTPTHKRVWFQIDLPDRPTGTRSAGPPASGFPPAHRESPRSLGPVHCA